MKRFLPFVLALPLAVGCSSGKAKTSAEGAAGRPTAEEAEKARKQAETFATLKGGARPGDVAEPSGPGATIVVDKETGKRLERIPKGRSYFVKDGYLYNMQALGGTSGLPLVREDAEAYYIEAPAPKSVKAKGSASETAPSDLRQIREFAASEAEVITPPRAARSVRFEELSAGLPKSGFWRTNMAVGDIDGDGRLEIVTPPPRLTISAPRVFKFTGKGWEERQIAIGGDQAPRLGYGGVAIADMNGDGRPDIVTIGHVVGVSVLLNEGSLRFHAENRGLPDRMSGRAVAVGDIDGDGRPDIIAQSDAPPAVSSTAEAVAKELASGAEVRTFLAQADGTYAEVSTHPDYPCFGYALVLDAAPSDGKAPFFYSSCRYGSGVNVLYTWDKALSKYEHAGVDVVEKFAYHIGGSALAYGGKPAVAATVMKVAPEEAKPQFSGYGVTVYYRDGAEWKARRVVKLLSVPPVETQGIGTGDVDGDGLDDIVWADDGKGKLRVFLQTRDGGFEEIPDADEPNLVNKTMSVRVADIDGDGKNDVMVMYEYSSSSRSRSGGLRFFRNLR